MGPCREPSSRLFCPGRLRGCAEMCRSDPGGMLITCNRRFKMPTVALQPVQRVLNPAVEAPGPAHG